MKKESKKINKLTKIVCAGVLIASVCTISGCDVYYSRRTPTRTHYINPSYPSHLRGTRLDPYPPGRRGYGLGIRITRPDVEDKRSPSRPNRPYTPRTQRRRR